MRRVAVVGVFVLIASACGIAPRDGQFRCPDGRCPTGLTCESGVCRTMPGTDAGSRDAPGLDVPGLDAPGLDAPGLDAPGLDAPIDAGPAELCAPDPATGGAVDEDLDGRVDEGCTLSFGPIHPVLPAMRIPGEYIGMDLVEDGLSSVVVEGALTTNRPIRVARRTSLAVPFAAAIPLSGTASASLAPMSVTVNGAGTEIVVQARDAAMATHLYDALGSVATGSFASLTRVAELDSFGAAQLQPSLSRDGLELFFVAQAGDGSPTIIHARRAAAGGAWAMTASVGRGLFPRPSEDGHALYFFDPDAGTSRILTRASRASAFGPVTSAAVFSPLGAAAIVLMPTFHARSRELFFTLASPTAGARLDIAPLPYAIFRAEVCADGSCSPTAIPCVGGTLSVDQLHCYRAVSGIATLATQQATCSTMGHLPTIHSVAEDVLIRTVGNSWLASSGLTWLTGEPWLVEDLWSPAGPAMPMQCGVTQPGGWLRGSCTGIALAVCEDEMWPVFVAP